MNNSYEDITSRIAEPPTWWDSNGVPRWGDFEPEAVPSIYADEVVFFLIRCQDCGREFHVALEQDDRDRLARQELQIQDRMIHYGDPPNHGCVGDSMNSIPVKVIEFWQRDPNNHWGIRPKYEGSDLVPDWARTA